MSNADWWARKTGRQPAPPPPPQQYQPPPGYPPQQQPPPPPQGYQQPPPQPYPPQGYPPQQPPPNGAYNPLVWPGYQQQQPQPPPPGYAQQPPPGYPPQQYQQPPPPPQLTEENFFQATQSWQGGEATKTETERCPGCAGNNYFSRTNTGGGMPSRGAPPAAHCYDCGYPLMQSGSILNAGGQGQQNGKPVKQSRQTPYSRPVAVTEQLNE